jgi:hypothetical protein
MGWSSGTAVVSDMIDIIQSNVEDYDTRVEMYVELIEAFRNHDWDNYEEVLGEDEAYDEAYDRLFPEYKENVE